MKLVYIAGPYSTGDTAQNIENARAATANLLQDGYSVFCPHTCYSGLETAIGLSYFDFISADIEILSRCDIIYMMRGWEGSPGACAELAFARRHKIVEIYE